VLPGSDVDDWGLPSRQLILQGLSQIAYFFIDGIYLVLDLRHDCLFAWIGNVLLGTTIKFLFHLCH